MGTPFLAVKVLLVRSNDVETLDKDALNGIAKRFPVSATSELVPYTIGFSKLFTEIQKEPEYCFEVDSVIVMQVVLEERKPSKGQVRKRMLMKIVVEKEKGEEITAARIKELKEEARLELLREIDPAQTPILIAFDVPNHHVWLGTAAPDKIKRCKQFLVESGFTVSDRDFNVCITEKLAHLLEKPNSLPEHFDLGNNATMFDNIKKARSAHSKQDLGSTELSTNLENDKSPIMLELRYRNAVRFRVNEIQSMSNIVVESNLAEAGLELPFPPELDDSLLQEMVSPLHQRVLLLSHLIPQVYDLMSEEDSARAYHVFRDTSE